MSLDARSGRAVSMSAPVPASPARVRRASLVVFVLLLAEYGIGMYVNLYITVPAVDHGHSVGSAISNGPVILSAHAVIGLLLGLKRARGAGAVRHRPPSERHRRLGGRPDRAGRRVDGREQLH